MEIRIAEIKIKNLLTLTQTNTIDAMFQLKIDRRSVSYCKNFIFRPHVYNTHNSWQNSYVQITKTAQFTRIP